MSWPEPPLTTDEMAAHVAALNEQFNLGRNRNHSKEETRPTERASEEEKKPKGGNYGCCCD